MLVVDDIDDVNEQDYDYDDDDENEDVEQVEEEMPEQLKNIEFYFSFQTIYLPALAAAAARATVCCVVAVKVGITFGV